MLKELGFDDFSELSAWRHLTETTECVQFHTFPPRFGSRDWLGHDALGRDLYANPATFMLDVGVYYLGIHSLPWLDPAPKRPRLIKGESSSKDLCLRQITLAPTEVNARIDRTIFWLQPDGSNLEQKVADALQALRDRGLPWLETTRDIDEFIGWGLHGKPAGPRRKIEYPFTEEERAEWDAWMKANGGSGQVFWTGDAGPQGLPENLAAKMKAAREAAEAVPAWRDHTALDCAPYGEELLALLIHRGRWDEALEIQRAASDASGLESRLVEIEAILREGRARAGGPPVSEREMKRTISTERRMALRRIENGKRLLAKLEELRGSVQKGLWE